MFYETVLSDQLTKWLMRPLMQLTDLKEIGICDSPSLFIRLGDANGIIPTLPQRAGKLKIIVLIKLKYFFSFNFRIKTKKIISDDKDG